MEMPIAIWEHTINQETVQTVNARELYTFLEVNFNFNDWIANRIKEYGFLENKDFVSFTKILVKSKQNARPSTEYYLTLDMAKELAMIERNEKGKQARQYFIECERKTKQMNPSQIDYSNPQVILGVFTYLKNENERKDYIIAELTPKTEALKPLERSDDLLSINDVAKMLDMCPEDLANYLINRRWIYCRTDKSLMPYYSKINEGLMAYIPETIQTISGRERTVPSAKITSKGLKRLSMILCKQIHTQEEINGFANAKVADFKRTATTFSSQYI
ncbi:antA/AntB antirepressor family protein [Bartonella sp. WD12.1]|uniref:antA/AntB antirepressor family protein n=1 Tax=Bartonella sp. WD12.1 TaxID=1933903 RepID=UPI00099AC943|nr:antA/AntB antirepressor family protein [Bartonella sp. WD12.1]OPB29617.1 anti-repressor protein [Bartonella sp. WD12.1]